MATLSLQLPDLLEAAGVNVRVLDGWEDPARDEYYYREPPFANTPESNPAGHMHHHTASGSYPPNRDKANAYAGLSFEGSHRLYQERYLAEGYEAVYTIANAFPAPISSGAGDFETLERIRVPEEVLGRQGPDTRGWYGNTHYWNTEWILNGVGAPIDPEVWEMMVLVCQVQNDLMGWIDLNHIAHAHHTGRKIDLYGGQFSDTNRDGWDKTIIALRHDILEDQVPTFTHYKAGEQYDEYEEVTWLLFFMEGGSINVNQNSAQDGEMQALMGKTNVRMVTEADFDKIAKHTSMAITKRQALTDHGLYRYGMEVTSLKEQAFRLDQGGT